MSHSPLDPQHKLTLLLQNSPLAVIEWNAEFAIVEWNSAAERIFGYTKSEIGGQTLDLIQPTLCKTQVEQGMAVLISGIEGTHYTHQNLRKDGKIILCEWHNTPILSPAGQVVGVISMVQDITERDRLFQQKVSTEAALQRANQRLELKTQKLKQTIKILRQVIQEREQIEDKLRQSRNFLQLIIDNIPQRIFWKDQNSVYLGCNRYLAQAAGLNNPKEIIGKTDYDLAIPREEADFYRQVDAQIMSSGEAEIHCLWKIVRADGQSRWIDANKIPLYDEAGNSIGILGTYEDISDRKQAELALEEALKQANYQSNLLRSVIDGSLDWIFVKDRESRYILVNQSFARGLGKSPQEILGKTDLEIGVPESEVWGDAATGQIGFHETDQAVLRGEMVKIANDTAFAANGEIHYFDTQKLPLYSADGEIFGILGICRDITVRRQAEAQIQASQEFLHTIVDAIPDPLFVKDQQHRWVLLNRAGCEMVGCDREFLLGKSEHQVSPKVEADISWVEDDLVLTTQQEIVNEEYYTDVHGNISFISTKKTFFEDTHGNKFIIGTIRDITKRKQIEETLRQREETYRTLLNAIPDLMIWMKRDGTYLDFMPAKNFKTLNVTQNLIGKNIYETLPLHLADLRMSYVERAIQTGEDQIYEYEIAFEETVQYEEARIVVSGVDEVLVMVRDMSDRKRSEVERERVEEALRQSEARFQRLVANVPGMIYQFKLNVASAFDGTGLRIPYASAYSQEIFEMPPDVIQTEPSLAFNQIYPADAPDFYDSIARSAQTLQPWRWIGRHITPSGKLKWVEGMSRPERQADGSIVWDGVLLDVTERKRAEEHLLRMSKAIESTSDAIGLADIDGRALYHNPAFEQLLGYTVEALNAAGGPRAVYVHYPVFYQVFNAIHSGQSWRGEIMVQHQNGDQLPVELRADAIRDQDGNIIGLLGTYTDISDRKRIEAERQQAAELVRQSEAELRQKAQELEYALKHLQLAQAQLIQSEKMSSLGQLVAGVAHEINNPVNFIYGNLFHANRYVQDMLGLLHLYQQHYPQPELVIQKRIKAIDLSFLNQDLPKLLTSMQMGAERIQEIVQSLRTFSRKDEAECKIVDIHAGLESTLLILRNRLKEQPDRPEIEIVKAYGEIPPVECYPGQLNQVLMNILTNAIDAIEENLSKHLIENSKPMIWIATEILQTRKDSHRDPDREPDGDSQWDSYHDFYRDSHRNFHRDSHRDLQLCIRIADNGPGMSETIQQRIFDPFFTTKPVGKGTGMGMSISYQIITEKHQGSLRCFSTPGQGTEFMIQIPINPVSE